MTAPARFKQSDIKRAVKAATEAVGKEPVRVEVDKDGKVTVYFTETEPMSDLDKWRRERARAA